MLSEDLINFYQEDIEMPEMNLSNTKEWIGSIVLRENKKLDLLNYIFCTDEYLLKINQEYLQHDDYTDIITFDNSDEFGHIEGDIFISLERVNENAKSFNVSFEDELKRVLAHGVLHLIGYKDKTEEDQKIMRGKENYYLELYN